MATSRIKQTTVLVGLLSILLAGPTIYNANLPKTLKVMGVFRQAASTVVAKSEEFHIIADTPHCEDLHYHSPSNLIFTACEANDQDRYSWFPPLVNMDDPSVTLNSRGAIHVLDPKTMKSTRLDHPNFDGPFVTHGIDVISDPEKPEGDAVYIFAVNHIPNFEYYADTGAPSTVGNGIPKTRSRIEIFHHEIGTSAARHVRSVWDPLIRTPNDLVALSPTSFLVTNDHFYREGLMRPVEDMHRGAKWTDTVHVTLDTLASTLNDSEGVKATVALDRMHNNNGLGHGKEPNEVLLAECTSGILDIGRVSWNGTRAFIAVEASVQLDTIIDNPSYFADPFADSTYDGSSYLAPGLTRAFELHNAVRDAAGTVLVPITVWSVKSIPSGDGASRKWETKLLYEDDGTRLRSASAAVQVAIDPAAEGDRRRAWLFMTGFISSNIIAVKVDV